MGKAGKKILLALDGSERAFEAVRYVAGVKPFQKAEVVLFTVYSKAPDCYWDIQKEPRLNWKMKEAKAWFIQQERERHQFMTRAKKELLDAGFPEDAVKVDLHERKKGIARDILAETQKGYDAVILGRKGHSKIRELVLGSVTTKLLSQIHFTTLIVVGRKLPKGKLLIGMDTSEGSMRALNYAAQTLGGSDTEVLLMHVSRNGKEIQISKAEVAIGKVLDEARRRLMDYGFGARQISTQIITGAESRAGAIMQEARGGRYSTIVVGRRGLSKVQDFFMGRVSNKIIQMAREQAVWIVS
jgi:nucleotide-binding universal stress UspA family protein